MLVDINGVELHYETTGEGEPLLWLHGFFGAGQDWKYIFNEPPAGFRLIAPDLRGHAESNNPSGEFSFKQAADDILTGKAIDNGVLCSSPKSVVVDVRV